MAAVIDYMAVGALGGVVGMGELVSRYRDAPMRALRNRAAGLYIGINALAAAAALGVVRTFDWSLGLDGDSQALRWVQVAVAGLGAMAVFRSAIFVVRAGDQDVSVGPNSFLHVILTAVDRSVDRRQAEARMRFISEEMPGISFEQARLALPTICLALMQNLSEQEQAALGSKVDTLGNADLDDTAKSFSLGLALINVVGEDVLAAALTSLRDQLSNGASASDAIATEVPAKDGAVAVRAVKI